MLVGNVNELIMCLILIFFYSCEKNFFYFFKSVLKSIIIHEEY